MPLFIYQIQEPDGEVSQGKVEAQNETEARKIIADQGFNLMSLKQHGGFNIDLSFLQRISSKDLVAFSRQLSIMISADVPVVKSLKIIASQTVNSKLAKILNELASDVNGGMRLSDAMSKHKYFSAFYINMIKSGEVSGKFDDVLNYLADQQEKDYELRSKIKGAMSYPIFILSALWIMGGVMMVFVLPKMTAILVESNVPLPPTTKFLIWASAFMQSYWYIVAGVTIGAIVGLRLLIKKTMFGKFAFDFFILNFPKFGKMLVQKIYVVTICRSLFTLVKGGVPISKSLRITEAIVSNVIYKELLQKTIQEVEDGHSVAAVFSQSRYIPSMISQMIMIGEQTGRLDLVLEKMAQFYQAEIDNIVANLTHLIEPVIILIMGGAVGFLVISIMLPMFKMADVQM